MLIEVSFYSYLIIKEIINKIWIEFLWYLYLWLISNSLFFILVITIKLIIDFKLKYKLLKFKFHTKISKYQIYFNIIY